MKILISPAKLLDYNNEIKTPFVSQAHFLSDSEKLVQKLKKMSSKQLSELMKLSEQLATLNYDRFQNWETPASLSETSQPAVTVFNGEVYKGLDVATFSKKDYERAQKDLRILSGLYGVLKPMDLIYPYRLEMGTRWQINANTKNLYQYWGTRLADLLNSEMEEGEVIINLASNEYFKAVDKNTLKARVITPVFKELKGDVFKTIMMYAKHARGAMARDIIQNEYDSAEDLKGYDVDGYSFNEEMSSENEWVFVR